MKNSLQKKQKVVLNIKKKFNESKCVIITDYRGITVSKSTNLRRKLKKENIEYKVLKNNLIKLACKELGIIGLDTFLNGPTAIVFGKEDILPSKIIFEFIKKYNVINVKGGLLNGKVLEMSQFKKISELPEKEILINQLGITFSLPIKKILFLFTAIIRNLLYMINSLKEIKEKIN